jgi:AcrR family transcriptional regulator
MNQVAISPQELTPKLRQIVEAAEKLFLSQGYGAVSMDQVSRTANVSKATLYAYFPSKDALFATIVRNKGFDNPFTEDLFPNEVADLRAALEEIGHRMLHFMLRERTLAIYRIALAEAGRFPELGTAFYDNGPNSMFNRFSRWIELLHEKGLVQVKNSNMATEQFCALVRSGVFLRRSLAVPPEASEEEITTTVTAAVDTWIKAYATL